MWSLTPEGQKALHLGRIGLLKAAFAEGVRDLEKKEKLIDLTNQIAGMIN
jgi:hypothetical protein